ncbi:MAG: sulfatase-like hydrolase/transferase, partial [Planctomycetota bacterium]|nr:sulfatase-like hydrolase/transferase [Planctomycetota bacterium]
MVRTLALLSLLVAGCIAPKEDQRAPDRPPNIVLILVDDLGWRDLGCTGSEFYETPNIDSLAETGLRSTAAYAACAVCSPSRAALQTGRHPTRSGITDWIRPARWGGAVSEDGRAPFGHETMGNHPLQVPLNASALPHAETTIAEQLRAAGYATAHIGKWHLGAAGFTPLDHGFDHNAGGCDLGQPPSYFDPFADKRAPDGLPGLAPRKPGQYLTAREAEEAQAFMVANRDRPFFLHLASYAVHTPLQAPAELVAKYRAKPLHGEQPSKARATYAAMVECVDRAVGQVLRTLDELGLRESTVVLLTSDN